MKKVNDFYVEASYNKTALISTISPVLTLPRVKMRYAVDGPGSLSEDARQAARLVGYEPDDYDLVLIRHTNVPGFTWGGLGGGGTAWLQTSGAGTTAHEIGHNYGLGHANFWNTRRDSLPANPDNLPFDADSLVGHDSVIGAGDDVAYGDPYDIMGSGGGESATPGETNVASSLNGHFNVVGKFLLGWLPPAYINAISSNGTNRVYVHDTPDLETGRAYALTVRKDDQRTYWVSARARYSDNAGLLNGVELHWGPWQQAIGYSHLLDTTPGSPKGSSDGAIQVGRTFNDAEANIHITPVGKGGGGLEAWFDVVVNFGTYATNVPPVAEMTYSTNQAARGQTVTFKMSATDANGDTLSYFWDFGDGAFGLNSPSVTKAWTTNGDFVVRCEVSDMKGGVTTKHVAVRVGNPDTVRISGRVLDLAGNPVAGMRVSNGALTNNDLAADYQATYTDSDGAYTLVNLVTNAAYPIGVYLLGYSTAPLNFSLPLQLGDRDATDANFQAQPLPHITVTTSSNAGKKPVSAGAFSLARTGDTNTSLRAIFLLGGTAMTKEYAPYKNQISLTNVNSDPFGAITSIYQFQYVDFATGAVTTNITITPVASTTPGEDTYVALSLMHPLQSPRIYDPTVPTNITWVNFTGWEIQTNNNVSTWFQTTPDYIPGSVAEAKLQLRGQPPTLPTVSIVASDPLVVERANDAGQFILTRYGRLDLPVTVALQWGGTATAAADYVALPDYLTIPAGETFIKLPVVVLPDKYLEQNETVQATILTNTAYNVGSGSASVTIVESDLPLVTIAATQDTVTESGGQAGVFTVTRGGDLSADLTVHYLVTGTAVSGQDYRALPGALTLAAGEATGTIEVTPRYNSQAQGDLTVVAFISDSPTYNIGSPDSATLTIQDSDLPVVSITASSPTVTEAGGAADFVVQRAGGARGDLWVNFQAGGTARQLIDYAGLGNRVKIPAGASQATITLTALTDDISESPDESVTLLLLPGTAYNLGSPYEATITITGSGSGQVGVGFTQLTSSVPVSVGSAQVAVMVSANPAEGNDVTVDYKITGGTAIAGVDYPATNATGRLIFTNNPASGEADMYLSRVQYISLPLLNNHQARADRSLVIELVEPAPNVTNEVVIDVQTDPNNASASITNYTTNVVVTAVPMNAVFEVYRTHTLTIVDDNASVVTVEATDPAATEAGAKAGVFTLRRTGTNGAQQVYFALSGRAVNGRHYQAIQSPAVIPDGASSLAIPVVPIDDSVQEFMADVTLTLLEAPRAALGDPASATLNIVGNDGAVEFVQSRYYLAPVTGLAQIPVHRTGDTSVVVSVAFFATAGTATNGVDFLATNGTLTFYAGETLKYLPVTLLDDGRARAARTVNLALRQASDGAPLGGQDQALLTIMDDRSSVQFVQSTYRAVKAAGSMAVKVRREGFLTNAVTVDYLVKNLNETTNSAQAGVDFTATNGTINFAAGQTEASFLVPILGNPLAEGDKTALLVLTNTTGKAALGTPGTAALVIVDDACHLEFTTAASAIEEYARSVTLTIHRSGSTLWPVSVDYATQAGTALPNRDFAPVSGTASLLGDSSEYSTNGSGVLEFHAGETEKTIKVSIIDNVLGDGDRQFSVRLSNPRAQTATPASAISLGSLTNLLVTILDDETPGYVDAQFNPGQGANDTVATLALQSDGKVIVGGEFSRLDEVILNHVARLHTDGYLDSFLNPGGGTDQSVYATTVQTNGRVVIAGDFTQLNDASRMRVARLNADGTNDASFIGTSINGAVRAVALQANGAIWIGGEFATVGGASRNGLARLRADGSLDAAFNPGAGASGGAVYAVAPLADGSVLAGGAFAKMNGSSLPYLARLAANGTVISGFPGGSPDGAVRALAVQPDGRILIGGDFHAIAGGARNGIARLNADGTLDRAFNPGTGANDAVYAVGFQADGKVFLGGAFTSFDGQVMNRFGRLHADGSLDEDFSIGGGANDLVRCLVVQPDSAVIIGGDFTTVRGLARNRIARVHSDEVYVPNKIQFTSANYQVLANGGQATISVKRSGHTNTVVSVGYLTVDGTAKAGVHYTATQGTLDFAAGETWKTFTVPILNSGLAQGDLSVGLQLTNIPSGFKMDGVLSATLTIESLLGAFSFAATDYTADSNDGVATISVTRTGSGANAASVDYSTQDGTASHGADYTAVSGTLVFKAGVTNLSFTVPLIDIGDSGDDKTVVLKLTNAQGGTALGAVTGTLTIHNVNQGPFYTVSSATSLAGVVSPASGRYAAGTVKQFIAVPLADYRFTGWQGATNSTANPLVLSINQDYSLTALFEPSILTYDFAPPFTSAAATNAPWSAAGALPWKIQQDDASAAEPYALRSGAIGDGVESVAQLRVQTRAGVASFHVRVSSEAGWDFLKFYVNGVAQQSWSGEAPWQTYQFAVNAGTNVFTWRYVKDASFSMGLDAAFISDLYVPLEIAGAKLQLIRTETNTLIQINGAAGHLAILEASSDLEQWQPISTNLLVNPPIWVADSEPGKWEQRFYRVSTP